MAQIKRLLGLLGNYDSILSKTVPRTLGPVLMLCIFFSCAKPKAPPDATDKAMSGLISASKARKMYSQVEIATDAVPVPMMKAYIEQHLDYTAYHLLLFLRHQSPDLYATINDDDKARVLCSALAESIFMNDWGFLDSDANGLGEPSEAVAAKALLDVGKPALPYLLKLLDDKGTAPMFGSEEATAAAESQYRRCDFAYRYVMRIIGRRPCFLSDLLSRDERISSLQDELVGP